MSNLCRNSSNWTIGRETGSFGVSTDSTPHIELKDRRLFVVSGKGNGVVIDIQLQMKSFKKALKLDNPFQFGIYIIKRSKESLVLL